MRHDDSIKGEFWRVRGHERPVFGRSTIRPPDRVVLATGAPRARVRKGSVCYRFPRVRGIRGRAVVRIAARLDAAAPSRRCPCAGMDDMSRKRRVQPVAPTGDPAMRGAFRRDVVAVDMPCAVGFRLCHNRHADGGRRVPGEPGAQVPPGRHRDPIAPWHAHGTLGNERCAMRAPWAGSLPGRRAFAWSGPQARRWRRRLTSGETSRRQASANPV